MIRDVTWSDLCDKYDFPPEPSLWPLYKPGKHSLQPEQFRTLLHHTQHLRATRVLELGVNEGHVARGLLSGVRTIDAYIGVDLPSVVDVLERNDRDNRDATTGHLAMHDPRFCMLVAGAGTQAMQGLFAERQFDVCLIDADHTYAGVKRDTEIAESLVRAGGMIFWHDARSLDGVRTYLEQRASDIEIADDLAWETVAQ